MIPKTGTTGLVSPGTEFAGTRRMLAPGTLCRSKDAIIRCGNDSAGRIGAALPPRPEAPGVPA